MIETTTVFKGSRLREARRARAMKASTLSDLIDVSPSSISQYEKDKQVPPPHVVARIVEKLNLPGHFFTAEPEPPVHNCLRWRSQAPAKKTARERAEQKYEWFRRVIRVVEQCVELPASNLPQFSMPSDPLYITKDDIEQVAEEVREAWGLAHGPISNVVRLVENNGGVVVRYELGDNGLDAFSDVDTDRLGRYYIILGTDKGSAVRSRHDVAHELAHMFLHGNVPVEAARDQVIHKEMESQAARFASAFLMPSSAFPLEVFSVSLDGLLQLKRRWGVSVASMVMRLADLELIDDSKKRYLFVQMSRRRWRKREPLDDEIAPEEPQLIRRSMEASLQAGVLDLEQLVLQTHLPIAEIERLMGMRVGQLEGTLVESDPPFRLRLSE
jgi:Zn-dependent peptidase ImmA (M78 family)/transcriptional regulator with XRE-family HTH domain